MSILLCKTFHDLALAWDQPLPVQWEQFGYCVIIGGLFFGVCLGIYYDMKGDDE